MTQLWLGGGTAVDPLSLVGFVVFFFNDPATPEIYPLSLHGALPIYIRRRLEAQTARDIPRRSLVVIPTRDGQSHYCSRDGEYWRTFVFIEGVQTFEAVESPDQALQAGRAFGEFQSLLVDLPDGRLNETILGFHN